jgi:N-acetylglutamate synthase/N-acetylornithine aminotransferase
MLSRKQAVAASKSNQRRVHYAIGKSGGGSSNPRGSASRQRKSVPTGAEGVQDAGAEEWMLRSAKRMPRQLDNGQVAVIVRLVRGQQQHFRTKLEEEGAPVL